MTDQPGPPPATRERIEPPIVADERTMLEAWLDFHRATLVSKIRGLNEEEARRSLVPSRTTLLGLVKHLAYVERGWFQEVLEGRDEADIWKDDDPDVDFRLEDGDTIDGIVALYEEACGESRAVAARHELDDAAVRETRRGRVSLRWIFVHMIEETARHNGHADILREQIDGQTGV